LFNLQVQPVAFSPNGQLLASGSGDETIKLWDPPTGELRQTLEGHSNLVQSVAFSPDGQLLASSSDNKTFMLWDPITGERQQTLEGHTNWAWPETNVGIFIQENRWICFQGEKMLWLPSEYRPIYFFGNERWHPCTVALGHASGRVSFVSRFI
jgi:WD40 repeat protein